MEAILKQVKDPELLSQIEKLVPLSRLPDLKGR